MCVIAISPKGRNIPDDNTISRMFWNNPDGAGLMWHQNGRVQIEKGFMTLNAFLDRIDDLKEEIDTVNTTVIMHFRISTAAGVNPQCTHPFPITANKKKMKALKCDAGVGMVHNGIIHIDLPDKSISDTMEFDKSVLCPIWKEHPNFYKNSRAMEYIDAQINGSRMAFLLPNGRYYKLGTWVQDKSTGILYSNNSYFYDDRWFKKSTVFPYAYDYYDDYPWEYNYMDEKYFNNSSTGTDLYCDFNVTKTSVCLCSEGYYALDTQTGQFFEATDYDMCFDADGNAFYYIGYDKDVGGSTLWAEAAPDIQLFTPEGTEPRFVKDDAIPVHAIL